MCVLYGSVQLHPLCCISHAAVLHSNTSKSKKSDAFIPRFIRTGDAFIATYSTPAATEWVCITFLLLTLPVPWGGVKTSAVCELVQTLFSATPKKNGKSGLVTRDYM